VQVQVGGDGGVDALEEAQELLVAVPTVVLGDHRAAGQVESLDTALAGLAARGSRPSRTNRRRGRARGPVGSPDPDGYRIELVQWPAGHADGITEADFA
jgi:hypothetical protein